MTLPTRPNNAACEGFFGRLKNEFFYGRDWSAYSLDDFISALNDYIIWYNEVRIKKSLGFLSPLEFRQKRDWLLKQSSILSAPPGP